MAAGGGDKSSGGAGQEVRPLTDTDVVLIVLAALCFLVVVPRNIRAWWHRRQYLRARAAEDSKQD